MSDMKYSLMAKPRAVHRVVELPEVVDENAITHFPDATFTDDAWYQNLSLVNLDRSEQKAHEVVFERSRLERVSFVNTRLTKVRWSDLTLEHCDLTGLLLEQAIFERVIFKNCRLFGFGASEAHFEDVIFEDCDARYARLLEAKIGPARFLNVNLSESSFQGAQFSSTVFSGCDLGTADLCDTKLEGTDFRGSKIEGLLVRPKDVRGIVISPDQAIDLVHLLGVQVG
jgi:uncharacterized protein YjbI with pentapeptide repeats